MTATSIERQRTAIGRIDFSRPIRLAIQDGLINNDTTLFDYGRGRGDDTRRLQKLSIELTLRSHLSPGRIIAAASGL